MKVRHKLTVQAKCPVDQKRDVYTCYVYTTTTIKVEDIQAAVAELTKNDAPVFQEQFTQDLHRALAAKVKTIGYHSTVQTVVIAG